MTHLKYAKPMHKIEDARELTKDELKNVAGGLNFVARINKSSP